MRKCFRVVAALAAVTVMTMTSVITSGASGWKQDSNGGLKMQMELMCQICGSR